MGTPRQDIQQDTVPDLHIRLATVVKSGLCWRDCCWYRMGSCSSLPSRDQIGALLARIKEWSRKFPFLLLAYQVRSCNSVIQDWLYSYGMLTGCCWYLVLNRSFLYLTLRFSTASLLIAIIGPNSSRKTLEFRYVLSGNTRETRPGSWGDRILRRLRICCYIEASTTENLLNLKMVSISQRVRHQKSPHLNPWISNA